MKILLIWVLVLIFLFALLFVYRFLLDLSDPFERIKHMSESPKYSNYKSICYRMIRCGESVRLHMKQNKGMTNNLDDGGYKVIYEDIHTNAVSFIAVINSLTDTASSKAQASHSTKELEKIATNTDKLVHKLSELDNLYVSLRTDAALAASGQKQIDDLIESLRELV